MAAAMLVGQGLAESLVDAVKAVTATAKITTSANSVLWTGTVSISDTSETDGSISITTAAAAATATGTPAKVKFYNGSDAYQWQTTIGTGGSVGFVFAGDITSGNSYQFAATSIAFAITAENG